MLVLDFNITLMGVDVSTVCMTLDYNTNDKKSIVFPLIKCGFVFSDQCVTESDAIHVGSLCTVLPC